MALQIQKDVSGIYETCKDGSMSFVSNIDLTDVLLTEDKYWLNSNHIRSGPQASDKGKTSGKKSGKEI